MRHRDARLETSLDRQVPKIARLERSDRRICHQARPHHERHIKLAASVLREACESRRCYADDGELDSIETHGAPDDRPVCTELTFPKIMSENRDRISPW